jgi:peptide/nickel transport system permease protein
MFDRVFFPVALLVSSIPFFVFGMLLVYYFAVVLGWFPAMGGYADEIIPSFSFEFFGSVAYHYVLPFFSIFLILAGGQAIGMRSMGIYELGTDYIKYAKWLGIKESRVLIYLFRNAMLPQLTGLALSLGTMIGGALITEMIFSYPGLGMAMLSAIQNNDYPMIQGVTLIITTCVLIANFTVDIMIGFLDPRVKAGLQMGGN